MSSATSSTGPQRPGASDGVLTVRPVRAAFGPAVNVVSVDSEGRLWVRFSTAVGVMIAGSVLLAVPAFALWWVGGGLVDSGQVDLDKRPGNHSTIHPGVGTGTGSPTELPLADPEQQN